MRVRGKGPMQFESCVGQLCLSLRVTKKTAKAIGQSMSTLVDTEMHIWLNQVEIEDKERVFFFCWMSR